MNPEGKRAAIMEAGERLFAAKGYTHTGMAEIAGEAGVAVGTVYRLFPDKPSLLAALHAAMENRFIAAMTRGWESSEKYPDRFRPMLERLFEQAEAVRDIMPLYAMTRDMIGASRYEPGVRMIAAIETMYAQGVEAGAYRRMPVDIVGPIAHAMVEGGMRAFMARPSQAWKRKVVSELNAMFERAFLTR